MTSDSLFYHNATLTKGSDIWLEEDTARHVMQVLRMRQGDSFRLTDGHGTAADVTISQEGKKKCAVHINDTVFHKAPEAALHLCIAFTKNTSRNEWLLEKATELGVNGIIPLMAARSERERIRPERWQNIIVSAMLQSQQYYLPLLHSQQTVTQTLDTFRDVPQKLMAHCIGALARTSLMEALKPKKTTLLFIGPEGDFTEEEVQLAAKAGCAGISLGHTRLRTETAAMSACALFNLINS
ncbi:RsmE family RNA methyltransferase [Chitinophagaceae bacterium MMS25-I14]